MTPAAWWIVGAGYGVVGNVAIFVTRKGLGRTLLGRLLVGLLWPALLALVLGLVVVEMVTTDGEGSPDDEEEDEAHGRDG